MNPINFSQMGINPIYQVHINLLSFFLKIFFLMWAVLNCLLNFVTMAFIEFVTIPFLFPVLFFWPRGKWDLSPLTRH